MSKGERTRKDILHKAFVMAGDIGLENLSLGSLATETGLSKSGLFAHFKSKETLQLQVIADIRDRFIDHVLRPVLNVPRGEARMRAFFDYYLDWLKTAHPNGGCVYVALSYEYDGRPGLVRDQLAANHLDLLDTIERIAQTAIDEGYFQPRLDLQMFAFEFMGIMMTCQHRSKFLRLPDAFKYARDAFEGLLARSRIKADR